MLNIRKTAISAAIALAVSVTGVATASAAIVTATFSATVVNDLETVHNGDTLTGSFSYESSTAPEAGSSSITSVFHALTSLSFVTGSYSGSSSSPIELQIGNQGTNGTDTENSDRLAIVSRASDGLTDSGLGGLKIVAFILRVDDGTGAIFSDAQVLPTDLQLSSFPDGGAIFILFNDGNILASITSLTTDVPEPAALGLLGVGLLGLGLARRRRAA